MCGEDTGTHKLGGSVTALEHISQIVLVLYQYAQYAKSLSSWLLASTLSDIRISAVIRSFPYSDLRQRPVGMVAIPAQHS